MFIFHKKIFLFEFVLKIINVTWMQGFSPHSTKITKIDFCEFLWLVLSPQIQGCVRIHAQGMRKANLRMVIGHGHTLLRMVIGHGHTLICACASGPPMRSMRKYAQTIWSYFQRKFFGAQYAQVCADLFAHTFAHGHTLRMVMRIRPRYDQHDQYDQFWSNFNNF